MNKGLAGKLTALLMLVAAPICACSGVSKHERRYAQEMALLGNRVSSSELKHIKKTSRYFPFLLGMSYLEEGNYRGANEEFKKLSENYKQSGIAKYYYELSMYGINNLKPFPELLFEFNKSILNRGKKGIFHSELAVPLDEDPLYKDITKAYHLTKRDNFVQEETEKIIKWINALQDKTPKDYLIAASLEKDLKDSRSIVEEGLKLYPEDPNLLLAEINYSAGAGEHPDEDTLKGLSKHPQTLYGMLLFISKECRDTFHIDDVEVWTHKAARPLCEKQISMFESTDWDRIEIDRQDMIQELTDHYNERIKSHVGAKIGYLLYINTPTVSRTMELLNLSDWITASAYLQFKDGNLDKALERLRWNRAVYRALDEIRPKTLTARMVQFTIAARTWESELEIAKAKSNGNQEDIETLVKYVKDTNALLDFYRDHNKSVLRSFPIGWPPGIRYEIYAASRPEWVDRTFIGEKHD